MKRSTWLRLTCVTAAFALLVAACGTDEPTPAPEPEPEPAEEAEPEPEPTVDIEPIALTIGTLLPQTGALAPIIDALEEPIRMAAEEINADFPGLITLEHADSGTDPAIASENVDQFLTGSHSAIIGAAASGVSTDIVGKVQDAQVVMCSGSNTAASLSVYEPYYIRTAPSDDLQAPTLGDVILDDGYLDVAVVWRNDEYGVGFGELLVDYLEGSGATVTLAEGYDPMATSFADLMDDVQLSGAEALAMITFEEGGQMVLDMQGRFDGQVYIADGFVDTVGEEQLGGQLDLIEGFRGTYPSSAPESGEPTFVERFAAYSPGTPTIFSAHKYDCLMVIALAAQVAQSSDPTVFVNEIVGVTGSPGTVCSSFAECFALIEAGEEIDFLGASGPLDFQSNGQPGSGTYEVIQFGDDGAYESERQVLVTP
jgi:ABC-type branched-subunit amino acid transport system substrate-binding protein